MYKQDLVLKTYNGWYAIKPNHLYQIYLYIEDLALNNLQ